MSKKRKTGRTNFDPGKKNTDEILSSAISRAFKRHRDKHYYSNEVINHIKKKGSLCFYCKHFNYSNSTCDAFPFLIPANIITGRLIHSNIYEGQKGTFVFQLSKGSSKNSILIYLN